jgi:branched-chain amino acid transport system substrate-binding protein
MLARLIEGALKHEESFCFSDRNPHAEQRIAGRRASENRCRRSVDWTKRGVGAQLWVGADQAMQDINAKGGVLGKPIEEIVLDDACDPKQAVTDANQLASDGVVFVDGHYCSASTIPASQVYTDNRILEISPSSTTPNYTDAGSPYTFRTCGRDDEQAKVAAAYIAAHEKGRKIAVLDDNSTYGKGIAISRLNADGIELVYVGGYYADYGLLMREGAAQGFHPVWISESATATNATWQIAGPAAEGSLFTFPPPPAQNPAAATAVAELKAKGEDPGSYLLYSSAAVQVWAEAANKAHSIKPLSVARELKTEGPWPTVLGPISFDKKGDPVKINYQVYQWHNGAYAVVPSA